MSPYLMYFIHQKSLRPHSELALILYTIQRNLIVWVLAHKHLKGITWRKTCILKGRLIIRPRNGIWQLYRWRVEKTIKSCPKRSRRGTWRHLPNILQKFVGGSLHHSQLSEQMSTLLVLILWQHQTSEVAPKGREGCNVFNTFSIFLRN